MHYQDFCDNQLKYKYELNAKHTEYYYLIDTAKSRPETLFLTVNKLINPPIHNIIGSISLCTSFLHLFENKIKYIYATYSMNSSDFYSNWFPPQSIEHVLSNFPLTSPSSVSVLITQASSPTCQLDPAPIPLLKSCLSLIASPIDHLTNCSISSGSVPLS